MSLHLLKMAVGIESVDHLRRVQRARLARAQENGGTGDLRHFTRNAPLRARQVLDGGSIYWIIRGYIRARQRILGIERFEDADGRRRCALILDPALVQTELQPQRPIQGWRYLDAQAAPADRAAPGGDDESIPPELADELRALGLL